MRMRRKERPPFFEFRRRRLRIKLVGFFHEGIDDVRLASAVQLLTNEVHDFRQFSPLPDGGQHSAAIGGFFAQSGNLEIAVEGLREGARDRRCGHDQHIRRISARDQSCALQDAELVLFVNDDEPKIFKFARFVKERVRSNDDLGSICVSRVLFGVPPNRGFRRDAGNCTRGRVRSPNILFATRKPDPWIVLICVLDAGFPRVSGDIVKFLLEIVLGPNEPIEGFLFPNRPLGPFKFVDLVSRKGFQGLKNFGEGKEHSRTCAVLVFDCRLDQKMDVIRHHAGGIELEARSLMQDRFENNIAASGSERNSSPCGEADHVLRPRTLEMRQIALRVADLGSIRVSRVLFGVPPNRGFRRDAGNCTRGRVRSPKCVRKERQRCGILVPRRGSQCDRDSQAARAAS